MLPFHRWWSRYRSKQKDRQSQAGLVELSINIHKNQATNLQYQCEISSSRGKLENCIFTNIVFVFLVDKRETFIQYNAFTNIFEESGMLQMMFKGAKSLKHSKASWPVPHQKLMVTTLAIQSDGVERYYDEQPLPPNPFGNSWICTCPVSV